MAQGSVADGGVGAVAATGGAGNATDAATRGSRSASHAPMITAMAEARSPHDACTASSRSAMRSPFERRSTTSTVPSPGQVRSARAAPIAAVSGDELATLLRRASATSWACTPAGAGHAHAPLTTTGGSDDSAAPGSPAAIARTPNTISQHANLRQPVSSQSTSSLDARCCIIRAISRPRRRVTDEICAAFDSLGDSRIGRRSA